MRRISVSLLAISFFIATLCSCETVIPVKPVCYFTADAQIKSGDITYDAVVTSAQGQNIVIELTSPDTLKGVTYTHANDTMYIEYDGLKCTTNADYLPSCSPVQIVIDTLLSLCYTEPEFVQTDGDLNTYTAVSQNGKFTLYTDSSTGFIKGIKPSYTDCEISFEEITDTTKPT